MRAQARSVKATTTDKATRGTSTVSSRRQAPATETSAPVSEEERRQMISRAAYFRAELRCFAPGGELQDWLAAEADINGQLGAP